MYTSDNPGKPHKAICKGLAFARMELPKQYKSQGIPAHTIFNCTEGVGFQSFRNRLQETRKLGFLSVEYRDVKESRTPHLAFYRLTKAGAGLARSK